MAQQLAGHQMGRAKAACSAALSLAFLFFDGLHDHLQAYAPLNVSAWVWAMGIFAGGCG